MLRGVANTATGSQTYVIANNAISKNEADRIISNGLSMEGILNGKRPNVWDDYFGKFY